MEKKYTIELINGSRIDIPEMVDKSVIRGGNSKFVEFFNEMDENEEIEENE